MPLTLFTNALIVNEGKKYVGHLAIEGDVIKSVAPDSPPVQLMNEADEVIDLTGCYLFPGVIDDHVHFREPGLTHKADIASESRAAVAGGVTSFFDMPNVKPMTVDNVRLAEKKAIASRSSVANYAFYIGATDKNIDELLKCDYTGCPGVKLFLGSSTGNMLVDDKTELDRIFSEVPAIVAVHAEDENVIHNNLAYFRFKNDRNPYVSEHSLIRSREACIVATSGAIERAREHDTQLHVLHVTTAEEVAMFSPEPLDKKLITSEVCVHHLWFTEDDYERLGSRIKMNPSIKTAADREALRQGLREGRIDLVGTDHAPHLLSDKEGDGLTATSGAPMVQFSLPVMLEMADQGVFDVEMVVDRMCHKPAQLFGVVGRGYLRPGYSADIVVVRPGTPYTVTDDMVISKCGWTPLNGTTLHNRVERTYVNGNLVYKEGEIVDDKPGQELKFAIS